MEAGTLGLCWLRIRSGQRSTRWKSRLRTSFFWAHAALDHRLPKVLLGLVAAWIDYLNAFDYELNTFHALRGMALERGHLHLSPRAGPGGTRKSSELV